MLSMLLVLILLLIATESTFLYPFGEINHYSRLENQLDTSNSQSNKIEEVLDCNMETLLSIIGLEELQYLIESVAVKNGMNPLLLLRKILKRMSNKDDFDKIMSNGVDNDDQPILNQPTHTDLPPATKYSAESIRRAPYALPNDVMNDENDETDVLFIPVDPSPLSKIPVLMKPENKTKKDNSQNSVNSLVGKINNVLPVFLSPLKTNHLKPPPGATVRVSSGDPLSLIGDDIFVTVSPLMTFIEALRQAEIKYQDLLGISPEVDVFNFAYSAAVDCYIVNSIDNIVKNKDFGWKVTILDKDGEMVYDNFCLPSGNDVSVKPGTVISLTYVPKEINL